MILIGMVLTADGGAISLEGERRSGAPTGRTLQECRNQGAVFQVPADKDNVLCRNAVLP